MECWQQISRGCTEEWEKNGKKSMLCIHQKGGEESMADGDSRWKTLVIDMEDLRIAPPAL